MEQKLLLSTATVSGKPMSRKMKGVLIAFCVVAALAGAYQIFIKAYKAHMVKLYELRDPKVENEQTLLATAAKYQLNKAALVTVAPAGFRQLTNDFGHGLPEALIFDKQGNYIEYKATDKSCNAGLLGFIPALDKNGRYKMTAKTTLSAEMSRLRDLRGGQLPGTYLNPDVDYYILVSWAAFAGMLNKDHVKAWESLAANNIKAKIQMIEVNRDVQQWWPEQSRDSILKM
jgi:hypothetical protein